MLKWKDTILKASSAYVPSVAWASRSRGSRIPHCRVYSAHACGRIDRGRVRPQHPGYTGLTRDGSRRIGTRGPTAHRLGRVLYERGTRRRTQTHTRRQRPSWLHLGGMCSHAFRLLLPEPPLDGHILRTAKSWVQAGRQRSASRRRVVRVRRTLLGVFVTQILALPFPTLASQVLHVPSLQS